MEKEAFHEVIGVYKDLSDSMKRIEITLKEIHIGIEKSNETMDDLSKHFKNGFKGEIINRVNENYKEVASNYKVFYTKEFNLLFYKLLASSTILVALLSLIVYIASKGKIKLL